jgi:hypothetical protein
MPVANASSLLWIACSAREVGGFLGDSVKAPAMVALAARAGMLEHHSTQSFTFAMFFRDGHMDSHRVLLGGKPTGVSRP